MQVNDDNSQTDKWEPCVHVDSLGGVNVVFYDSRIDPTNNVLTQVYMGRSTDGGASFQNYQVSDVAFTPSQVPNTAPGYMGDYLGITSTGNYLIPCWNDNRTGNQQAYTARIPFGALSGTIANNTTINGLYSITANVTVNSNATLTIDAGTELNFAPGKEMFVKPGSKIIANGTSGSPVRFQRLDPSQKWGQVYLYGNGNTFNWTLFDGGNKNVGVHSTNNTFTDCTFRNAWRGISSGTNNSGGGNSSFNMTDCMVENNSSVGVVAYYSNVSLSGTTIQGNGQAGLWLYSSSSNNFQRNAFISNGATSTGRSGMEVLGGSDISFTPSGLNLVANNPTDQITVDAGSSLSMGDPNTQEPGYNSVYGGSEYRINNQSSMTVNAYGNWWGSSSPPSYIFYGPVDYSGNLSYDPCVEIGGCGVTSGQYPEQVAPYKLQHMIVKNAANTPTSESTRRSIQTGNHSSSTFTPISKSTYRKKRRSMMHSLWPMITNNNNAKSLMSEIHELYLLDLESRGDTSFTSERQTDRSLWRSIIQKYMNGNQVQNSGGARLSAKQAANLMLMDEHEAQRFGRYTEADKKIKEYAAYITAPRQKVALEIDHTNLLNEQGNYKKALAMLDNVEKGEISLGMKSKRVHALYQIAQNNMQQALNGQLAQANNQNGKEMDVTTSTDSYKTSLQSNYPNPFNPTTVIKYELAKKGQVHLTIWNILGQKVATLVNTQEQKGIHQVTFNAMHLSSGIYFYRLQAGDKILVKKMLLLK